jgi:hypothetical protein
VIQCAGSPPPCSGKTCPPNIPNCMKEMSIPECNCFP